MLFFTISTDKISYFPAICLTCNVIFFDKIENFESYEIEVFRIIHGNCFHCLFMFKTTKS